MAYQFSRKGCFKCGNRELFHLPSFQVSSLFCLVGHIAENCSSDQRLCYNCRQPGHESSACPSPRTVSAKQCYSCGGVGHIQGSYTPSHCSNISLTFSYSGMPQLEDPAGQQSEVLRETFLRRVSQQFQHPDLRSARTVADSAISLEIAKTRLPLLLVLPRVHLHLVVHSTLPPYPR